MQIHNKLFFLKKNSRFQYKKRYSDESEKTMLYEYVQKRRKRSGTGPPNLLKLWTFLAKIKVLVYNIYM